MTGKQFLNTVVNGRSDIVQSLLDIFADTASAYCVIGGLTVNAYVEPIVSLDLDVAVATADIEATRRAAETRGLAVERFEHSINLKSPDSDLRIRLQTDSRYQDFIPRAQLKDVLGYKMKVAGIEDVLEGKIWAYTDRTRRKSKRQKDLADIFRIIEAYPHLAANLPPLVRAELEDT
jgi:hypothetical protein